ncbi:organic cation transporter protein-like [Stylophora pistillata]|uniref:Organic cation transporter protein n=1 Tax=Stylophora pistillata TaxID=50429 RepID=A0A2B4RJD7_STYPI|nr:organic cation transporter protein-like [Stylophora pistillata]PFX17296.1 Organic cation transporter protein [Stylophora pistillata]
MSGSQGNLEMERSRSKKSWEFDDILDMVGGFGRYSFALYAFMCIMSLPIGLQQLVQVFYAATPKYSCVSYSSPSNETCSGCCNNCEKYEFKTGLTSAVTEWNLICDRRHLKAMTQSVYMAGLLLGSVAFSTLSDHFGRKISVFLSILFMAACGTVSAVSDCLSLFSLFRFGAGAATAGCLLVRFVYCMEIIHINNRTAAGMVNNIFVSIGFSTLSLLGYFIRDWRHLMLVVSLPAAPLLLCYWLIPESPRWLIAKDRLDEAHELLMKYAKKNGVTVESTQLKHVIQEFKKEEDRNWKESKKTYGILDMVRTPKLRKRTLICGFNWFVNALVYFGINLNVGNLAGDMYLNFFILCIVEIPGALALWFFFVRFGRRIPYALFMIIGGTAELLVLAVPSDDEYKVIITVLAVIGKSCILATFLGIYIYTVELYPTIIRNTGIGVCSMMARFGSIITPYIVLLADLPNMNKTLPLVIFGVFGLIAGVMALWLPETRYSPMAQTVEQVEAWKEDYKIHCCTRHSSRMENGNIGLMEEKEEDEEETPITKDTPPYGEKYDTVV